MSGGGPSDDDRGRGLESLLDAQTRSAESWAAALPEAPSAASDGGDFGLEQAVERLQAELAHESVLGPSPGDVLGRRPPSTATPAAPGTGRVVGAPPVPLEELVQARRHDSAAHSVADVGETQGMDPETLSQRPMGQQAHRPVVDTGPIQGDPFAGRADGNPINAGQSQVGLGVGQGPFPSDYYGRDTPMPPGAVPGPAYGDSGAYQSFQPGPRPDSARTAESGSWPAPGGLGEGGPETSLGDTYNDSRPTSTGLGRPESGSWPAVGPYAPDRASDEAVAVRDGNTARTAIEPLPEEVTRARSSNTRTWLAFALVGVVVGAIAVVLLMRGWWLEGSDADESSIVQAATVPPGEPEAPDRQRVDSSPTDAAPTPENPAAAKPVRPTPPAPAAAAPTGVVTIEVGTPGGRVFAMAEGPDHRFSAVPAGDSVLVLVTAPGHIPRTRQVEPDALTQPVVLDLDRAGSDAVGFPFDLEVPQWSDAPRTASVLVSSNTPGAQLGVMVGEAPTVTIPNAAIDTVHRFLVVHPDHPARALEVRPDQWTRDEHGPKVRRAVVLGD